MRIGLAGLLVLLSSHVMADQLPPDIRDAIQRIGPVINAPETARLLAPLQRKEPYDGATVIRDEKYDSDERNRLDVFRPNETSPALPVLVFVHGGGYERGDKRAAASPFYDNVMLWAVAHRMVGVNMITGLASAGLPLLVAHGELDIPYYTGQAEALKARLCQQNRCPTFETLRGQSHMSEIYGLNTIDTSLSDPMWSFVEQVATRTSQR